MAVCGLNPHCGEESNIFVDIYIYIQCPPNLWQPRFNGAL